jgi:hypothetical protein
MKSGFDVLGKVVTCDVRRGIPLQGVSAARKEKLFQTVSAGFQGCLFKAVFVQV